MSDDKKLSTQLACLGCVFAILAMGGTLFVLLVSSIEDGPDATLGFWAGWRHGLLSPFVVLGKALFHSDKVIYISGNSGWLYDAGFLIGIGVLSGLDRLFELVGKTWKHSTKKFG